MRTISNKHFTVGGTGITNFDKKDYDVFDISIKEYEKMSNSNKGLHINLSGFHELQKVQDTYYSLHDLSDSQRDLGGFWDIWHKNKAKLR